MSNFNFDVYSLRISFKTKFVNPSSLIEQTIENLSKELTYRVINISKNITTYIVEITELIIDFKVLKQHLTNLPKFVSFVCVGYFQDNSTLFNKFTLQRYVSEKDTNKESNVSIVATGKQVHLQVIDSVIESTSEVNENYRLIPVDFTNLEEFNLLRRNIVEMEETLIKEEFEKKVKQVVKKSTNLFKNVFKDISCKKVNIIHFTTGHQTLVKRENVIEYDLTKKEVLNVSRVVVEDSIYGSFITLPILQSLPDSNCTYLNNYFKVIDTHLFYTEQTTYCRKSELGHIWGSIFIFGPENVPSKLMTINNLQDKIAILSSPDEWKYIYVPVSVEFELEANKYMIMCTLGFKEQKEEIERVRPVTKIFKNVNKK
jgi:hypothetical protein